MKSYKELFNNMLNDCHKYDTANNAKIQPFPTAMSKEQQSQTKGNNKNNTELRF
jgi:hypothetical protein